MPESDDRRYWIVKHGLDAFEELPNFIWEITTGPRSMPHRYEQIKVGDRWIAFAYTTSDYRERALSLITGFYECTRNAKYRRVPKGVPSSGPLWRKKGYAWIIEGKPFGRQPRHPVGVPPLDDDDMLGKPHFKNQTLVPISAEQFDQVRCETLRREFNTEHIPLLSREPIREQELLATVSFAHKKLGIEKIVQVQKAFPDLLVRIDGHSKEVYLELEVYSRSFILHRHHKRVKKRRFKDDDTPVAILCWIDDDPKAKRYVHRVYELQSLIREGKKIRW